jgi:hypothetical protein
MLLLGRELEVPQSSLLIRLCCRFFAFSSIIAPIVPIGGKAVQKRKTPE